MRERTYGPREPVAVTWRRDRAPRQERYVFQRRVLVACLVTDMSLTIHAHAINVIMTRLDTLAVSA